MVLRLWVPRSHWLWARNWNRAAAGAALTASRVANRVAVSTPLRFDALIVLVISVLLLGGVPFWRGWLCGGELMLVVEEQWSQGSQFGGLGIQGASECHLQRDDTRGWRVDGPRDGRMVDRAQRAIPSARVFSQ